MVGYMYLILNNFVQDKNLSKYRICFFIDYNYALII